MKRGPFDVSSPAAADHDPLMNVPIPFVPFRRFEPLRFYQSNRIPHWRQGDCTYFVTFRLGDSLPEAAWREMEHERSQWLDDHGGILENLSEEDCREFEHRFAVLLDASLDRGFGRCLLRKDEIRTIVVEAFRHLDRHQARVGDFVIMPNHVHVLLTPLRGVELEASLKALKGFTSREINRWIGSTGSLWQRDSYDRIVRDGEELGRIQDYIAGNPVAAGLPSCAYTHERGIYEW
jgi:REP element-mobilizing transposase RayT